jgi:hypothetical protein
MTSTRQPPWLAVLGAVVVLLGIESARAGEPEPFTAGTGLALAASAASAWAADAELIYVENDEPVAGGGEAARWGYLYFSKMRGKARAYSIREGKIRTATDLPFDFEAPPLPAAWIDSAQALRAADADQGAEFREKNGGSVRAMFLVRGILHTDEPDAATWAVVYDSPTTPGLWVVVNAATGKVVKTWRG